MIVNDTLTTSPVGAPIAPPTLTSAASGVGWIDHSRTPGSAGVPAMPTLKRQLDGVGERQLDLGVFSDGSVRMTLDRAPYEVAVFSGGGNKCLVIPWGIEAMEAADVLKGIKHICGASGGALIGMALASGMSGRKIREFVASMNMMEALDSSHPHKRMLQKFSAAVAPKPLKSMVGVLAHLNTRAHGFQATLEEVARSGLLKSIKAHQGALDNPRVREVHDRLVAGGTRGIVTFGDLAVVSAVVPNVRTLEVTSTAMLKSGPELVIFNHQDYPAMSVAKATLMSGAFPFLFHKVAMEYKGEMVEFQDGGLMSNTPVPQRYLKPSDPALVSSSAPLVMVFEKPGMEDMSIENFPRNPADDLIGVETSAKWILQQEQIQQRLKDRPCQGATLTRSGDYSGLVGGTMNFYMPAKTRAELGQKTFDNLLRDLQMRKGGREAYHFASLDDALLALDDKTCNELYAVAGDCMEGGAMNFRQLATGLLNRLEQLGPGSEDAAQAIVEQLDEVAQGSASRCEWLARRLMQNPQRLAWLQAGLTPQGKQSQVVQAVERIEQRNHCQQIALHIAGKLSEYCLKSGQGQNKALLGAVCKRMIDIHEQTREKLGAELDLILQEYRPRHPNESSLLEFARACKKALATADLATLAVSFEGTLNTLPRK